MLNVPLHRQFRYVHEPLSVGDTAIPVLGHEELVGALKERLTYSRGGTFLVTGFRGVGKSTLVLRALAEAAHDWGSTEVLLTVHLNVARSMTTDQLLFAVVRRIFESLDDRNLLQQLPREVQHQLLLAYTRTSLSFKQTQSDSTERGGTMGIGPQKGPLASLSPTLGMSGKRTRSLATEAAFLAYSETDVEHDLVRIIHLLNGNEGRPTPRRLLRRRNRGTGLRVHPVVILDEVDKLTDNREEALEDLELLLGRLKNVLTARGAHFILVAGPDLLDRAIRDSDRGNGLHESVFGWRMYVPCLWEAPERLVRGLSEAGRAERAALPHPSQGRPTGVTADQDSSNGAGGTADPEAESGDVEEFIQYLRFKARGVPRRLLQEFNHLIEWEAGVPSLRVHPQDWARITFYSNLESIVSAAVTSHGYAALAPVPIDEDRWRMGGYHVVDWALRSKGRVFTSADVVGTQGGAAEQALDPLLRMDRPTVERLLRHLAHAGVLDVVSEADRTDATFYGRRADVRMTYYKLTDAYKRQVAGFARHSESERADLGLPAPGPYTTTGTSLTTALRPTPRAGSSREADPRPDAQPAPAPLALPDAPITVLNERYEVRSLIGQGGMGAVHQGKDLMTGKPVAIKLLHPALLGDETSRARFRREADIGMRLSHPHIVHTLTAVDDPEPALIMELIQGPSIQELLDRGGPLPPGLIARISRELGEALEFTASLGLSRLDLKPSNVLMEAVRGAVIVDLGLARFLENGLDRITRSGYFIGTPAYMAPEQLKGDDADIRSDIYSLGVLLHQCVTGQQPYQAADVAQMIFRIIREDLPVADLPVSPQFRDLIRKATAREAGHRHQTPEAFLTELAATPEAAAESGPETVAALIDRHLSSPRTLDQSGPPTPEAPATTPVPLRPEPTVVRRSQPPADAG
ncbi:protein kinase domain-containing protein [Streptomyces sp. NPDC001393]